MSPASFWAAAAKHPQHNTEVAMSSQSWLLQAQAHRAAGSTVSEAKRGD